MSASVPPSGSTSPLAFPGAVLTGRYRLEEVVGHGGMGSVWRATHLGLGEQVAVKLVSANFVRSAEALRRFDNEAKSAAKLRSRHVPQVFDNGVLEDGTPFLVMELLHGESLAARINRLGPIPLPETVSIVEQCCRALSRAHSLGIVHRDIKPENVYLAQSVDDDGYVVKVLDFGIAKVTSALSDDGRSSTRTGTLLGTPLYMSPEQARGLRSVDFRTDLYSVGLVTFTMLTGRLPFAGETLGELLLQICAEPLPTLRAAAPALPPSVEDWFQRACARQAEDRHPSAQALVESLRVAAGISSAGGAGDSMAARIRGFPPDYGPALGDPLLTPQGVPGGALHVPSTTEGTSLGASSFTSRPARWVVVASAIVGLAAVPAIVLLVRGRRAPTESQAAPTASNFRSPPGGAGDLPSPAVATPATTAGALRPQESDAASSVVLTPLVPNTLPSASAAIGTTAVPRTDADKPTTVPARAVVRPGASVAPAASLQRPATAPRPPTKPTGDIDLGY